MALSEKHEKVLKLLIKDEQAREYFFQTASSPLFLEPLSKNGFFSFKCIPENSSWFQYRYLVEVAKEINENISTDKRYIKYLKQLLTILKHFHKEKKFCSAKKIFLVFECFCEIFKILPSDKIPLQSIKELVSLNKHLPHLNIPAYHIIELIKKFIQDKDTIKAQEIFQSFFPILLNSKIKENDKNYFMQKVEGFPFFIEGNKSLFDFLLKSLSKERESRDIVDHQFNKSIISLNHKNDKVMGKVTFNNITYSFTIPEISYENRDKIVQLICKKTKKIPCKDRIDIANEIKSLYYTSLWKRHYSIYSLFGLEKEDKNIHTLHEQLILLVAKILIHQVNIQSVNRFKVDFLKPLLSMDIEISWRALLFFFGKMSPKYNKEAISFLYKRRDLLFVDSTFEGEVFDLLIILASSCRHTSQQKKLIDLVNQGPYWEFISNIAKATDYKRYWKKKWFAGLLSLPEGEKLYKKLSDIPKEWINSRDSKVIEFVNKSPFKQEDILRDVDNDLDKFVNRIREFDKQYKPDEKDFFNEKPSIAGLEEALEKATNKFPEIMFRLVTKHDKLDIKYVQSVLNGLTYSRNKMNLTDWEIVFSNIIEILKKIFFSNNSYNRQQKEQLVMVVLGIISEKSKELKGETIYSKVIDIIEFIYDNCKSSLSAINENTNDSYVMKVFNSFWGMMARAIIGLSLAYSPIKINPSNKNIWEERAQNLYDKLLSAHIPEVYVFLGYRYDCFRFFNKRWLDSKVKNIDKKSLERKYFWGGYIYSKIIFPNELQYFRDDYHLLAEKKIYVSSIQEMAAERLLTLLINQQNWDNVEREIDWLVKNSYPEFLSHMARSLYHLLSFGIYKVKSIEEKSQKIKMVFYFWNQIYSNFKNKKLSIEETKVMENLLLLSTFIPHMTQKYRDMILESLRVCTNHYYISFLENLLEITKRTPKDDKKLCGEILNYYIEKFSSNITWQKEILLKLIDMIYSDKDSKKYLKETIGILQESHLQDLANEISKEFSL